MEFVIEATMEELLFLVAVLFLLILLMVADD